MDGIESRLETLMRCTEETREWHAEEEQIVIDRFAKELRWLKTGTWEE